MTSSRDYSIGAIIGASPALQTARSLLARIAASPAATVLLYGETGTGKDLAARVVHQNSARHARPLVTITCSAVPEPLLESELFGHERGAFTDARQQKPGLLELADGGTVFLDEIGSIAPAVQVKLLRFLEERTFKRIGGLRDIHVDVRVIAAANSRLEEAVGTRSFREDLYYRLRVMQITLPPLRDRVGDIALLAGHFVNRYNEELGRTVSGVTTEALDMLERHDWPGNIRELRNVIERAMLLLDGDWIASQDLDIVHLNDRPVRFQLPQQGLNLQDVERDLLIQALERTRGNQTRAGYLLGINRDQVRYRIEKFGIPTPNGSGSFETTASEA
jgi:transcriptional regulator with PAS, ATPase and Fis domain